MISDYYTTGHIIQRLTTTQDSTGGIVETWTDYLTVSGKLWALGGTERLSADKITVFASHKFVTDIADIAERDRLVSGGKAYNIKLAAKRLRQDGTGHMELDLEKVE